MENVIVSTYEFRYEDETALTLGLRADVRAESVAMFRANVCTEA